MIPAIMNERVSVLKFVSAKSTMKRAGKAKK